MASVFWVRPLLKEIEKLERYIKFKKIGRNPLDPVTIAYDDILRQMKRLDF